MEDAILEACLHIKGCFPSQFLGDTFNRFQQNKKQVSLLTGYTHVVCWYLPWKGNCLPAFSNLAAVPFN